MKEEISAKYVRHVLEKGEPKNVFKFCEYAGISEKDFYNLFGSLDVLRSEILSAIFHKVHHIIKDDEEFKAYSAPEKLLAFYFTWFQELAALRSYLLHVNEKYRFKFERMFQRQLHDLFFSFVSKHEIIPATSAITSKIPMVDTVYEKGFWMQFLLLNRIWINDASPAFTDTDAAVEKSVKLTFELLNVDLLDSMVDFGKFMIGILKKAV